MLKVAGVGVGVGVGDGVGIGVGAGVGVGVGEIVIDPVEDSVTWVDNAALAEEEMSVIEIIMRIRITIVFFNAFLPRCYWHSYLCGAY